MKGKRLLVTHEAPDGIPRAFAIGPADDPDLVREEAKFQLDGFTLTQSVLGDPISEAEFTRREVVLA